MQPVGGSAVGWSAVGGSPVIVAQGETLDTVSGRYGVPASALLAANGLSSASEVHSGMRIIVPVYHANGVAVATAKPKGKTGAEASAKEARKHEREVAGREDKGKAKDKAELSSKAGKAKANEAAADAASPAAKTGSEKPASTLVAKAEAGKPGQGKKSAVEAVPTANLENGAAEKKAQQADASGASRNSGGRRADASFRASRPAATTASTFPCRRARRCARPKTASSSIRATGSKATATWY